MMKICATEDSNRRLINKTIGTPWGQGPFFSSYCVTNALLAEHEGRMDVDEQLLKEFVSGARKLLDMVPELK